MTTTRAPANQLVQGPVHAQRWASVGFRLDDEAAVPECRRAARWLLETWKLTWVPDLIDDVLVMVSELVTNVQRHAGPAHPAGSFTLWHPARRLVLTVHDKGELPWRTNWWATAAQGNSETGRGLALVRGLAEAHCGEFDVTGDGDLVAPGKVMRVRMLLPDVQWPTPDPPCPWGRLGPPSNVWP
ncbi:ATP-binding protein [Streptomyces avermitilis]|uniref:ATP-binding protein n=1 Tax=Streptomyces avermitilis TaxID=33903 RepID=UPI003828379B